MLDQPKYYKSKLSQKDFEKVSRFILEKYGINISPNKKVLLEYRLQKRLVDLGLHSYADYVNYLFSEEGIVQEPIRLIDEVSTNKTDFFREIQHFNLLKERILPNLPISNNLEITPVWSAGCSSGEEAYSLAMILEEYRNINPNFDYQLIATDISEKVLQIGKRAIYPLLATETIETRLLRKYFLRSKNPEKQEVRVSKLLRDKVQFQYLNLMDAIYQLPYQYPIIFCRNTLIYFDSDTKNNIVLKLCNKLRPGGLLFISHTESLVNINHGLKMVYPSVYLKARQNEC